MKCPVVSVIMITYGHENFIEEAINSILAQKCNFDIELVVANDASPDHTDRILQKIIKKCSAAVSVHYINRSKNIGMMPNLIDAINQSCGNYIAMCEGDDYWIDEMKLQRQVDFLENNKEYVFCTHRYKVYSEFKKAFERETEPLKLEPYNETLKGVIIDKHVFHANWMTQPLTSLIRRDKWQEMIKESDKFKYFRDFHFFYLLLKHGNGFCMDFVGGVYRKHEGGIFTSTSDVVRYKTALLIYEELYLYSRDKGFFPTYWNAVFILLKKRKHIKLVSKSFFFHLGTSDKLKAMKSLVHFMNTHIHRKLGI